MNILQTVKDQLTSAAITQISTFLDEDPRDVTAGLTAGLPAILAGFMQKASTTQGAGSLLNLLKNDTRSEEFVGDITAALRGGKAAGLISAGSGILSSLFGDKVNLLNGLIGNISGLKANASSLLNLTAPLIMGVLSKKVKTEGIGVAGLASLLMSQKDAVKATLPAGMGSILNINSLGDFLGEGTAAVAPVTEEKKGGSGGLLPWLLLGLLILGGLYFWKSCQNKASGVATGVDSTVTAVSDSAESLIQKVLSTGVNLSFPELSIENELISFIEDKNRPVDKDTWFNFRKLTFESGSAVIDSTSEKEVDNIAEILKAFPDVSIKVGGYTDNTGSDEVNTKLSAKRAANVVAALVERGISAARLDSEGYGPQHPIADNATQEGREQNRRIAVRVTNK
ncbi:MAG: OmpA family protein [Leadbetterella sp.]|nr:OmpA family protein [Leadbetterella sp.]